MIRLLAILLGCMGLRLQAEEEADRWIAAGAAEFHAAYQAWDGKRFQAAADWFRQAAKCAPDRAESFYWLGAAEFHRMLQLRSMPRSRANEAAAEGAMDAAEEALTRALECEPRHAESHALLGTLHGMKIGGSLLRALQLGPRVQKHRVQALEYGLENPRVRYLVGVCQFHTAKKRAALLEALASLEAAERLFEAEEQRPAGPREPRWGHGSCLTFIGRVLEKLGDQAAAEYFRKALARQPADHLAREGLARVTAVE